jgi:hypothetical protein
MPSPKLISEIVRYGDHDGLRDPAGEQREPIAHELRGDRPLPRGLTWSLIWDGEPAGSRDDDDIADGVKVAQHCRGHVVFLD